MMACCEQYLRNELIDASPDVIICLGKSCVVPFKLDGTANEVMGRIYSVEPIVSIDGKKQSKPCKLIVTHSPDKFVEDYKIVSSVESAFKQANRLLSGGGDESPDNYYLIESPEEFRNWANQHMTDAVLKEKVHAFDIESNGREIHPTTEFDLKHPPKLRCISFSWGSGYAICVPIEENYNEYLPILKDFMGSDIKFIGHNVTFDYFFLKLVNGITTKRIVGDTMLMAGLVDPGRGAYGYGLKRLACEMTQMGGYETDMKSTEEEIDEEGHIIRTKWELADMQTMAPYNCADSD